MRRWIMPLVLLLLSLCPGLALAQWTEPVIGPIMMTAPLAANPPPVTGSTRYVDGSMGADCAGTSYSIAFRNCTGSDGQAWNTIQEALAVVNPGDLVYVRGGDYATGSFTTTRNGTAGNYITFRRYPGDARPNVNCAGHSFCFASTWAGDYYVWDGFEFRNSIQQLGVFCGPVVTIGCPVAYDAHHLWFINGVYHDSSTSGIADDFAGWYLEANFSVWSNNEFYNNPKIAWLGWIGHHYIVEFNSIHDNGRNGDDDGGIKCGGNTYACIMRYNTAWNNYRATDATGPCFAGGSNCSGVAAVYFDYTADNIQGTMSYMYNNIVFDNDHGLQVNCAPSAMVFNNLSFRNGYTPGQTQFTPPNTTRYDYGRGLNLNVTASGPPGDNCFVNGFINMQVYNNTVVNNWGDGLWAQHHSGNPPTGLHLRNNIFQNNAEKGGGFEYEVYIDVQAGTTGNADFNNDLIVPRVGKTIQFNGGNYTSITQIQARPGNTTWVNGLGTAATFVNAAGGNYHLQTGSPGIDQGATVATFNFDLENSTRSGTWDIGAYTFGAAAVAVPGPPANLRVVSP
jgi:hypothetical protein